jgi:hypothetical protein
MAAGLGFKTFTTGEVLTAGDVNGYLMQGVLVFASEAARNAAITSPQEGQFAYTKDNNSLWYYTGSAWAASGATGDIEGVTAGVGITGGGTSGTVTITNDMATTITASGDIVVGTGSGTYDNLPIGTTNQVLTADTSVSPYKVKWATAAAGGAFTLLSTTTLSASTTTVSSISQSYKHLFIEVLGIDITAFAATINYLTNAGGLYFNGMQAAAATGVNYYNTAGTLGNSQNYGGAMPVNKAGIWIYDYTDAVNRKVGLFTQYWVNEGGAPIYFNGQLTTSHTAAMTSFGMTVSTGSYDAGTIKVYGVN